MKYIIGDTVVLNSFGLLNYNVPDLKDTPMTIVGIIEDENEEYPYLVEFPECIHKSTFSAYCGKQNKTINYNGSAFKEEELDLLYRGYSMKKELTIKDFKVGDRIEFTGIQSDVQFTNQKGTIIEISDYEISVEFDKYLSLHSCGAKGKYGHCYYITESNFKNIKKIESEMGQDEISKYDYIMKAHESLSEEKSVSFSVDVKPSIDKIKRKTRSVGFKSITLKPTI